MTAGGSTRCRACAFEVPAGALRCPSCSAAQGPQDACPHCRAEAGTAPHRELRWVCEVCGGPRVPRLDRAVALSGRERPLLRKADAARKARAGWRAGAIASGLLLPVVLLFFSAVTLIFGASFGLVLAALTFSLPLGGLLAYAVSRASARGREIGPALDGAWMSAATDVAAQSRGLTAASLAQKLGLEEAQAEELMALLDVNDALAPRARIAIGHADAPAAGLGAQPTEVAAAEDEAALLERAIAEEEARQRKAT